MRLTPREIAAWCVLFDREERRQFAMLLYVTRVAHHGDAELAAKTLETLQGD